MYSAGVERTLRARHFLRGDFGEESVPHAHPYRVELICSNRNLDKNGFSTNIAVIEEELEKALQAIDDRLLNDLPYFSQRQPSLENLCSFLHKELVDALSNYDDPVPEELCIRIWESSTAWASYTGSGAGAGGSSS